MHQPETAVGQPRLYLSWRRGESLSLKVVPVISSQEKWPGMKGKSHLHDYPLVSSLKQERETRGRQRISEQQSSPWNGAIVRDKKKKKKGCCTKESTAWLTLLGSANSKSFYLIFFFFFFFYSCWRTVFPFLNIKIRDDKLLHGTWDTNTVCVHCW